MRKKMTVAEAAARADVAVKALAAAEGAFASAQEGLEAARAEVVESREALLALFPGSVPPVPSVTLVSGGSNGSVMPGQPIEIDDPDGPPPVRFPGSDEPIMFQERA